MSPWNGKEAALRSITFDRYFYDLYILIQQVIVTDLNEHFVWRKARLN